MAEDRIYSFLGLAHRKLVKLEYTLGIRNSYTELVREFIRISDSLDIICFTHVFSQSERISKIDPILPSWVPDWRAQRESYVMPVMASQSGIKHIGNFRPAGERRLRPGWKKYVAGGEQSPGIRFSEDLLTLTCQGILVDLIDGIGGMRIDRKAWEENRENFSIPTVLEFVQSTSATNTEDRGPNEMKAVGSRTSSQEKHHDTMGEIARCLTSDRKDRYLTYPAPSYFCEAFTTYC